MNDTEISFYLRQNRIHIFSDTLRSIGSPKFICFLIDETGKGLAICPYPKKDFHSHRVPPTVYTGKGGLEISSIRLCKILAQMYGWNLNHSYRISGKVINAYNVVVFSLGSATEIERPNK